MTITGKEISTELTKWQSSLSKYATTNYDENAFINSAILAVMQSDELQKCFNTPEGKSSLFQAMRFASTTGLSLNPQEGKAALLSYKGVASYQVMKGGMIELAQRSGKVKFITADTVRENDVFEIEKTAEGDKYLFKPERKKRGDIDGFFAAFVLNDGSSKVKYMTEEEVISVRDKSPSYKFAKNKATTAWGNSFEGMGLKTVIKALLRNNNISPEISRAIGSDDQMEFVDLSDKPEVKDITPKKEGGSSPEDVVEELKSLEDKEDEITTEQPPETPPNQDNDKPVNF